MDSAGNKMVAVAVLVLVHTHLESNLDRFACLQISYHCYRTQTQLDSVQQPHPLHMLLCDSLHDVGTSSAVVVGVGVSVVVVGSDSHTVDVALVAIVVEHTDGNAVVVEGAVHTVATTVVAASGGFALATNDTAEVVTACAAAAAVAAAALVDLHPFGSLHLGLLRRRSSIVAHLVDVSELVDLALPAAGVAGAGAVVVGVACS